MKRRIVTTTALAFCSCIFFWLATFANAQGQPQGPGAEKVQKLAQVLALTPQQRSQLAPIVEAEAPKAQAITQDPNLSGSEKAKKLKAVQSESDPLVKSILTPTQYKQWEQIRKDELQKIKGGG